MEAGQRYELLELTRPGPVETWAARDRSTGRDVSVHRLTGGPGSHRTLLERLRQLPESAECEILDAGEIGTVRFFVTAPWLREDSFEEWVIAAGTPNIREDAFAKAGTWRVPTVEFGRRAARPSGEPGEFTRMFQPGSAGATPTKPEPPPTPLPDPHPEPEEPQPGTPVTPPPGLFTSMFEADRALAAQQNNPAAASGGEFTRMFRAAPPLHEDSPTAEIPIASVIEGKVSDKLSKSEPSEFTRMFNMPHISSEEPGEPAPEARESGNEPGPFTRMFRAGDPPASSPVARQEAQDTTEPRDARISQQPGSFTEMFSAPDAEPSSGSPEPGAFTQMFRAVEPQSAVQPPPAAPPAAQPSSGSPEPGAFTQMFRAVQPESAVQPPPAAPPAAEPSSGSPEPGSVTQMFRAVQTPPAAPPAAEPASESPQPGAFTQMFQAVQPSLASEPAKPSGTHAPEVQSSPVPTTQAQEAGEFTRTFRMPAAAPPATETVAPAPPAAVPCSTQQNEPGEFTRNFRLSGTNPGGTPEEPPVPPAAVPVFQTSRPGPSPLMSTIFPPSNTVPQARPVPPGQPTTQEPGELTRLFQTSRPVPESTIQVPHALTNPIAVPPAPAVPEPPKPPAATQREPGEFTRMFQKSRPAAPQSTVQVPGEQPPQEPGEFTRMFQAPQAAPPSVIQPPQAQHGAGEFTRMFQSPSSAPVPAASTALPGASGIHPIGHPVPGTPQPGSPASPGPGEFTRMFEVGSPKPPQSPAAFGGPAPLQQPTPGDFDKHFNPAPAPVSPAAHPAYKDPLGANRAASGQEFGQPGEFTRMFGVPSVPPAPSSQTPSSPSQPLQPATPPQPVMGTYTKMFSTVPAPQPATAPPSPSGGAPAASASPQQQPGSFTTVMAAGGVSEPPASVLVKPPGAKAQRSAQRRSSGKNNSTPLYILLGVLIVAVVFLIIVLLFR